ncbi:MAG: hypothetical protein R2757_18085 [Draconibacterium sp.]
MAISYVSLEGARKNMVAEIPGWDFDGNIRKKAEEIWNNASTGSGGRRRKG